MHLRSDTLTNRQVVSALLKFLEQVGILGRGGWVEQNPEHWYDAFCLTVQQVLRSSGTAAEQITAVGIVGVTHNCVLLDDRDQPLRPVVTMVDTRSRPQVQAILERWGDEVFQRTRNDPSTIWSWPQLMWIREHQRDLWARVRRVRFAKDYVRHRLAPSMVTDSIDAAGTLLFDPRANRWIGPFCSDLGLREDCLPEVVSPLDVVGKLNRQGAADTGLAEGTPVVAGTTDTAAEVLGAGALRPGMATVKLASVGRIAVVATTPLMRHRTINYRHVLPELWYPGTASKYAASALRWLRDVLFPGTQDEGVFVARDRQAATVPPGAEGLLFHPHLMGQWAPHWNDHLRGNFLGLTARHGQSHPIRTVLEGVAFALRDALEELEGAGLCADEIRLIGQGSQSELWCQIVTDVLGRPVCVPRQTDAAFGAALIAAAGAGMIEPASASVERLIGLRAQLMPDARCGERYRQLFDIYRSADGLTAALSERLGAFEQQGKDWGLEEKGDGPHLCEAPFGPFRQMGTVPFFRP